MPPKKVKKQKWSDVFIFAGKVANKLADEHPKWTRAECSSAAWKTAEVIAAKKAYHDAKDK